MADNFMSAAAFPTPEAADAQWARMTAEARQQFVVADMAGEIAPHHPLAKAHDRATQASPGAQLLLDAERNLRHQLWAENDVAARLSEGRRNLLEAYVAAERPRTWLENLAGIVRGFQAVDRDRQSAIEHTQAAVKELEEIHRERVDALELAAAEQRDVQHRFPAAWEELREKELGAQQPARAQEREPERDRMRNQQPDHDRAVREQPEVATGLER